MKYFVCLLSLPNWPQCGDEGRFLSLMGSFPSLMGRLSTAFMGPFSLLKIPWETPIEERPVGGFLGYSTGPKMITRTFVFLLFGLSFRNCTRHLLHRAFWREFLCVVRAPPWGTFCLSASVNFTQEFSGEFIFPLHAHLSHKRTLAKLINNLCHRLGSHSAEIRKSYQKM